MGGLNSKKEINQVLICGLDGAGKTKFLYETIIGEKVNPEPTTGFNFEQLNVKGSNGKIGMWDLGGSQNAREFWSSFYQNVHITGIIFVFDVKNTDRLREAERCLFHLMHEDELREAELLIYLNTHQSANSAEILNSSHVQTLKKHILREGKEKEPTFIPISSDKCELHNISEAYEEWIKKIDEQ